MAHAPPCNSSASDRLFQKSIYVGINLQEILYGVVLALYFMTIHVFVTPKRGHRPYDKLYAIFSSVMILLITVWICTQGHFGEVLWVLGRTRPCDPGSEDESGWYFGCGPVAAMLLQLMTDALTIYRCWMAWGTPFVVAVPLVLWVITLTLGILMAWSSSTQGENFLFGVASEYGFAYYTITVLLNVVVTGAICYRMIQLGKVMRKHLGHECASVYFSIVTLIVESMLPYTLAGIAFLVSFGMGSLTSSAFLSVYILLMCLSSQLLIYRVCTSGAWNEDNQAVSTIKFASQSDSWQGADEEV